MRIRILATAAVAASLLSTGTAVAATPADTSSGQSAAARYFLSAVCPANRAFGALYDAQTQALKHGFTGRGGEPIPSAMIGPLSQLGTAAPQAAALLASYRGWPPPVSAKDVAAVRRSLVVDGRRASAMARQHAVPAQESYDDWLYATAATNRVRAALGLQGAGKGC